MKMKAKKHQRSYITKSEQVKCTCCGHYSDRWWMTTQGIGCASYLFYNQEDKQYQIESCYGSGYDTSRFQVLNNEIIYPKYLRAIDKYKTLTTREEKELVSLELVFCDNCIENYISKGYISEDINYNSMAAIAELSDFWDEDPILYMELMKDSSPENIILKIRTERSKPEEQRLSERNLRESLLSPEYVQSVKDGSIWDESLTDEQDFLVERAESPIGNEPLADFSNLNTQEEITNQLFQLRDKARAMKE